MSMKRAAEHYGVARSTLGDRMNGKYSDFGRGRKSRVFKKEEETKLAISIHERAELEGELTYQQCAAMIQDCLTKLVEKNPERFTGFECENQWPNYGFLLRFAKRNSLKLKKRHWNMFCANASIRRRSATPWVSTTSAWIGWFQTRRNARNCSV